MGVGRNKEPVIRLSGIALKKKFDGGVLGAKRQEHPHTYHASRLFPKSRSYILLFAGQGLVKYKLLLDGCISFGKAGIHFV
jgi:hypothetical protein